MRITGKKYRCPENLFGIIKDTPFITDKKLLLIKLSSDKEL